MTMPRSESQNAVGRPVIQTGRLQSVLYNLSLLYILFNCRDMEKEPRIDDSVPYCSFFHAPARNRQFKIHKMIQETYYYEERVQTYF